MASTDADDSDAEQGWPPVGGEGDDGGSQAFVEEHVPVRSPCPTVYNVDSFIQPRLGLLSSGDLQEFREWEVHGTTQIFGDIAQYFCTYAKSWVQEGQTLEAGGMKTIQLVRTRDGWRISALAWDDERDGLTINDLIERGRSSPVE